MYFHSNKVIENASSTIQEVWHFYHRGLLEKSSPWLFSKLQDIAPSNYELYLLVILLHNMYEANYAKIERFELNKLKN